jgi:hypothetical protein
MLAPVEQYRAEKLAALAAHPGVTLPGPVLGAVAAYQASMAIQIQVAPVTGQLAREAATQTAQRLVREAAASGAALTPLNTEPVRAARLREAELADQAQLCAAIRDAAVVAVIAAFSRHATGVLAALQAKHAALMADLTRRARRLPPGCTEAVALAEGGRVREDFLACRDLVAEEAVLRDAARDVEAPGQPYRPDVDPLLAAVQYDRSGRLYRSWQGPGWVHAHGPPGELRFWLAAAREDFEWWLPSRAEAEQRAAQVSAQLRSERAKQTMPVRVMLGPARWPQQ